jgi:hypothetical protein
MDEDNDNVHYNYNKERVCYICGDYFYEKENIGHLNCRIHPGIIVYNRNKAYYSCCGSLIDCDNRIYSKTKYSKSSLTYNNELGCLPIDHFEYDFLYSKGIVNINPEILNIEQHDKVSFTDNLDKRINELKSLSIQIVNKELYNKNIIKYPRKESIIDDFDITYINNIKNSITKNKLLFNNTPNNFIKKYDLKIYTNSINTLLVNNNYTIFKYGIENVYGNNINIDIKSFDENFIGIDIWEKINELNDYKKLLDKNKQTTKIYDTWNIKNDNKYEKEFHIIPFMIVKRISNKIVYTSHGYYT